MILMVTQILAGIVDRGLYNGARRYGPISSTLFVTETDRVNLVIGDNI